MQNWALVNRLCGWILTRWNGEGLIKRTHGGAVLSESAAVNHERQWMMESLSVNRRIQQNAVEKDAIGRAAAAMIKDGESLMIEPAAVRRHMWPIICWISVGLPSSPIRSFDYDSYGKPRRNAISIGWHYIPRDRSFGRGRPPTHTWGSFPWIRQFLASMGFR